MIPIPVIISAIEDESDREFMENLFLSYQRLMYYEINHIIDDCWLAEDVMQSTIVKLINNIETIRHLPTRKLVNYLISACKNTALNELRNKYRHNETLVGDWYDIISENTCYEDNPEFYVLKDEEFDILAQLWDKLDERSKYLLRGRYILNLTYDELARELHVKPESIRMALTRARRSALSHLEKTNYFNT